MNICKVCGKESQTKNICWDCFEKQQQKQDIEDFKVAKKLKPEEFKGQVLSLCGNHTISIEHFIEEYKDQFDKDMPKFVFAYEDAGNVLSVDILSMIESECNDNGYEDMFTFLDTKSEKLKEAQKLIDEWILEQGDKNSVLRENRALAIDLREIYEQLLKEKSWKK